MRRTDYTRTLCAHLYAHTVRQLKQSSPDKLSKRLYRIHKLERSLHIPFGRSVLHCALPMMLAAMLGTAAQAHAQVFADPVVNPFGLTTPSQNPKFVDIDADGDIDIFGEFQWWENIGTAVSPSFAPPVFEPFGITEIPLSSGDSPGFADLDNDLDPDMLAASGFGDFYYYENIGTPTSPLYGEPVLNPMGFAGIIVSMNMSPAFADIDSDGDMDFFTGSTLYYYQLPLFYQNTGTAEAPFFIGMDNVFGTFIPACTDYDSRYALGDMDNDGDLDMVAGFEGENTCILTNIGSPAAPSFILSPLSIPDAGIEEAPALGDLDGDGDNDLMVANVEYGSANWSYFENLDCRLVVPGSPSATAITPTSATLNWSPAEDGYDFVVKIRDLTTGGIRKKYVSDPTYTFTSLTPGHDYAFTVWTECADFDTRRGPSEVYYFSTPMRAGILDAQALIYPNPAHDQITIDLQVFDGSPVLIRVYNTIGESLTSILTEEQLTQYMLSLPYPSGTYYVQLIAGEKTAVAAIIKN